MQRVRCFPLVSSSSLTTKLRYMKLGLQGITILYSSGDHGVAGNEGVCCKSKSCAGGVYVPAGSGTFNPSFPGTCPYITSVGATQIVSGAAVTAPEQACESVIYSGGGFSNVFALPSYQASAVKNYFKNHKPSYSSSQYESLSPLERTRGRGWKC
jgi:tripeptidyl-peptidase I